MTSGEFRTAICSQPETLRTAAAGLADALSELDLRPLRNGTIVFSGIGASAHALTPAVLVLRAAGRRAFSISAGELRDVPAAALGDAFVLVSQSGTSMETVEAIGNLDGAPTVAITAHGESPLAGATSAWLPLGPIRETEVASVSYTATLQALGMLCDALLGTSSGWQSLPEVASQVLEDSDATVRRVAERFTSVTVIDAVGGGPAEASARETALLAREGLRMPAAGMETREYLHGPLEAVEQDVGCVVFGGERERELATELASFGAAVALVSDRPGPAADRVEWIEIPRSAALVAPILQILPVQLLVDTVAGLRGLKIGKLRRRQPDTKLATPSIAGGFEDSRSPEITP